MAIEQARRRKVELEAQWHHIQDHISSTGHLAHTQLDSLVESVETAVSEAEQRDDSLREAVSQGATEEQIRRVYRPFIKQLDSIQSRLTDLQQALLYLEINHYQSEQYSDRLTYVEELCCELADLVEAEVAVLPVVWDGYAAFDIQYRDFYAVHVPRDESPVHGAPIVGHEFGHVVVDLMEQEDYEPFRTRLQEILPEWRAKRQPMVRETWRGWFKELACDAFGVLSFGAAYLVAMIERLYHRDPYELPRSQINEHPPDALRFEFVNSIAENILPSRVYTKTGEAREGFNQHLTYSVRRPPPDYQSWVDEELLDMIEQAVCSQFELDIAELSAPLIAEETGVNEAQELRYEANEYWLSRQNGG